MAVYSDADAGAPHVLAADRAVRIGPPPAAESYLNVAALLDAARTAGADAVHPGYGFLSERAHFARAVRGRRPDLRRPAGGGHRAPGIEDRRPPADGGGRRAGRARRDAPTTRAMRRCSPRPTRIGFPLLVKPSAGGGGIGMKAVRALDDLPAALGQARREATAAFGDARSTSSG